MPTRCPDCGGTVDVTGAAAQYQEDLPPVRPVVRRFDIQVGHCSQCRRRIQGRHPLQTSDALGAASAQLGPGVVALVAELHTRCGLPLAKVADLLQARFGLQVTPGGLQHLLHRAARDARPAYEQLREQVRNAPVVTVDETGWRVGAASHWLWAAVTPTTTVYAICAGRGFDDAQMVLGANADQRRSRTSSTTTGRCSDHGSIAFERGRCPELRQPHRGRGTTSTSCGG